MKKLFFLISFISLAYFGLNSYANEDVKATCARAAATETYRAEQAGCFRNNQEIVDFYNYYYEACLSSPGALTGGAYC